MFNRTSLFRILVKVRAHADLDRAQTHIVELLTERHGEEDITCIRQDSVVEALSGILNALTLALAAIAAISLSVAGIGIMNVMMVSVSERTEEIGLLRALGAGKTQILAAFLAEAILLSTAGGFLGLAVGFGTIQVLLAVYPDLNAAPPVWAVTAALAVAVTVGAVFGVVPARRATRLDPVVALAKR
jgi:putative ABC transport system permease protein